MNQHPQLSTGQAAGCALHTLEQHPRDEARNAITADVIGIDEADRLYTAAPPAALGFETLGRSSKFRGARVRSFDLPALHARVALTKWFRDLAVSQIVADTMGSAPAGDACRFGEDLSQVP
jgi:hypothetical protein